MKTMSKELKALKGIRKAIAEHLHKQTGVSVEKHFEYLQNDTEISIVEKALTPPTVEEVCKVLSEFVGREVSYTNKQFHYIIKNTQVLMFVTETYNNKTFSLGVYLPPHLITLIGRFYEGEIR